MSTDAQDIATKPWRRRASDAWTNAAFRAPVLTYLTSFLAFHSWADSYEVTERFIDRGIDVRVPRRPPVQPGETAPFYQRPGNQLLIIAVFRRRDNVRLEVALTFTQGNETSAGDLATQLVLATQSLEAANRKNPAP